MAPDALYDSTELDTRFLGLDPDLCKITQINNDLN